MVSSVLTTAWDDLTVSRPTVRLTPVTFDVKEKEKCHKFDAGHENRWDLHHK